MTPAYRQDILPGQSGSDVKAVKLAYRKLGVNGSGTLALTKHAGPAFVQVTRTFQLHHRVKSTGVYDEATHAKLTAAVKWTSYMIYLYRKAKLRVLPPPPPVNLNSQAAAKKLVTAYSTGHYHDFHYGSDIAQLRRAAAGEAVWSQGGYWVHFDHRILDLLVWIIEGGHRIGTFALCSDHHFDGPHGHGGGFAADLCWFDGVSVNSGSAHAKTLELAKLVRSAPGALHIDLSGDNGQLICDGYGGMHSSDISALTIPGVGFYGYETMAQHRDHVHAGYFPV